MTKGPTMTIPDQHLTVLLRLAPCYLGPPKEVDGPPEGYARIYHNRTGRAFTDVKLPDIAM